MLSKRPSNLMRCLMWLPMQLDVEYKNLILLISIAQILVNRGQENALG